MILNTKNLSIYFNQYGHLVPAVESIDFSLQAGQTLVLLGESGCGKSLTSHALMRLLPENSLYGQTSAIELTNEDLLNLPESMMRSIRGRRLAMIFQEPMTALNPVLTIGAQLAEALHQHQPSLNGRALHKHMITLLKDVEMPEPAIRLKQYPHQLSGGQKQRIVIAMALANRPEILIADEPTTALDVTIQAQILTLLKKLQHQYKMSLLFITHDLAVAQTIADWICLMYAGQVVESSRASDFFANPLHPYAQKMFVALPSMTRRGHRLAVIPGHVPALEDMPNGCRFHPRCAHAFEPCQTIKPELQSIQDRFVRCHLYPKHTTLPNLPHLNDAWPILKPSNEEVLMSVRDLTVYYPRPKTWFSNAPTAHKAVDGISFDLCRGKTLALVGESGCGKTTVSRVLLKLQPSTSGEVTYRQQNIQSLRGKALRRFRKNVQIIFQDPFSSMNPRLSIADILAEGLVVQGMSRQDIQRKQHELLEHVGLPKTSLNRYPHQFSGGQRQRICIARALATEPEILICDEPTSALDVSVQAQILNLLKTLQYEFGLAYLFITHNMSVVSYLADDVLVMRNGIIVERGDYQTLFNHPKDAYTQQLLAGCPSLQT